MRNTTVLFLLFIALMGGGVYWFVKQNVRTMPTSNSSDSSAQNEIQIDPTLREYTHIAILADVTGGSTTGTVYNSYENAEYHLSSTFYNIPTLKDGFFYEGWIVRDNPLDVVSTGKLKNSDGLWINSFVSKTDLTDHTKYILTLEPDDDDPAPADHILEGSFVKL